MSEGKLIYEQIPKLVADAEAIGKERKNQQQGFMFRGIDDVMNMCHPLLARHKVFCTTTVLEEHREERQTQKGGTLFYVRLKCLFRFFTTDGSFVESTIIGEAMDSGDKATAKATSIAFKYAMFQLLCIPTEDDPDADAHEDTKPKLTDADYKFIADANMEIDHAKSAEDLKMIGEMIKDKSPQVREELRGIFTRRMKALNEAKHQPA